ncbi:hypothetical protein D7X33_09615 [Butyricicoccus sp. 1XD8-22]|nr:hypothetical protein D7X33_09615 [Butyricicoccus sp. 1XD8-22]
MRYKFSLTLRFARSCVCRGGRFAPAYRSCVPRLRGGRQGSALHPLGLSPQAPRCWRISFCLRAGRGLLPFPAAVLGQPAMMAAGWPGSVCGGVVSPLQRRRTKSRWHNVASGFSLRSLR